MSAIVRTGERFGMEHLVALLLGERTENILKFNHDRLPTFGVGAGRKAGEWRSIFRQLSATGLIAQDLMEHGRWWVTDEGWRVLKGQATIELRKDLATGAAAKGSRRDRKAAAASVVVSEADAALLEALKALRTKLAQVQKVPAYVVFSDRTLVELATHRPDEPARHAGDSRRRRHQAGTLWRSVPRGRPGPPSLESRPEPLIGSRVTKIALRRSLRAVLARHVGSEGWSGR